MTWREKLRVEHPECLSDVYAGWCMGCPHLYGYSEQPDRCCPRHNVCTKCWDREVCEKMFYVVINENGMYWARNGELEKYLNKAVFYSNLEYAKKTVKRFARFNPKFYSVNMEIGQEVNA